MRNLECAACDMVSPMKPHDIDKLAREACPGHGPMPGWCSCTQIAAAISTAVEARDAEWRRGMGYADNESSIAPDTIQFTLETRLEEAQAAGKVPAMIIDTECESALAASQAHVGRLVEASSALLGKWPAAKKAIDNVCLISQVHGIPYDGPTIGVEMDALAAAAAEPSGGALLIRHKDGTPCAGDTCTDLRKVHMGIHEPAPAPTAACDCCRKTCTNECQCFDKMPAPAPEGEGSCPQCYGPNGGEHDLPQDCPIHGAPAPDKPGAAREPGARCLKCNEELQPDGHHKPDPEGFDFFGDRAPDAPGAAREEGT